MSFNGFPSFRRKAGSSVSEDLYPKSKKVRDHKNLIKENSDRSAEHFEKKFNKQILRMFDLKGEGRVNLGLITKDEKEDVQNFIAYAAKRLAAGAITSPMFHDKVQRGRPGAALDEFAPAVNVGHDAMHSMMAYARTGGESLVPAYMKPEDIKELIRYENVEANLEEAYVVGFAQLGDIERKLRYIRESEGLEGEELVLATMESWENDLKKTQGFEFPPDYLRENRWPEFVTIVRNLLYNIEQQKPDPNFALHEFQRILEPLLDRLRSSETSPANEPDDMNSAEGTVVEQAVDGQQEEDRIQAQTVLERLRARGSNLG